MAATSYASSLLTIVDCDAIAPSCHCQSSHARFHSLDAVSSLQVAYYGTCNPNPNPNPKP